MSKQFAVSFPGNKKVDVSYDGFTVKTDQSVAHGGDGTAPEPFDLFWVSLAACAGIYAKEFCDTRGVESTGMELSMEAFRNDEEKRYERVVFRLKPPPTLPEKYHKALIRSINLCTVKKHVLQAPDFDVQLI